MGTWKGYKEWYAKNKKELSLKRREKYRQKKLRARREALQSKRKGA